MKFLLKYRYADPKIISREKIPATNLVSSQLIAEEEMWGERGLDSTLVEGTDIQHRSLRSGECKLHPKGM
jgi:hypothetical protein